LFRSAQEADGPAVARYACGMKHLLLALAVLLCGQSSVALARDEFASGTTPAGAAVPYVLTTNSDEKPRYAFILLPGGNGLLNIHQEGTGVSFVKDAAMIRFRALFAEGPYVAASTDATSTPDRIMAIVQDLERRYGPLTIYVAGISNGTKATMELAFSMDGKVAGFIHASSNNGIAGFDPRKLKSRQLIVLHRLDACKNDRPSNGEASHQRFGTDLIEMDGGKSVGDDCKGSAYHGYNGIERETVEKIKAWVVSGK
jgi:hypothetical protein